MTEPQPSPNQPTPNPAPATAPSVPPTTPPPDTAALDKARAALGQVQPVPAATQPPDAKRQTMGTATANVQQGVSGGVSAVKSALPRLPATTSWKLYAGLAAGFVVAGIATYLLLFYPAELSLTVDPATAAIGGNDKTGTGTLTLRQWPGTVALQASAPGYVPFTQTLNLTAGERRTLAVTLRPLAAPTPLTTQRIQFPVLDEARSSLLYLDPTAKTAYRLDLTNPVKRTTDAITPATIENVTNFIWAPNRQLAFMKQGDTTKLYDFKRYDLITQEVRDWPAGIGSIDWRPDGEKVAYYFEPGTGEKSLIRATKDNGDIERLYNLADAGITNPTLTWSPDAKYLAVQTDRLFLFDVFAKSLTEVNGSAGVKAIRWLPNSSGLVTQTSNDQLALVTTEATLTELGRTGTLDRIVPLADGNAILQARVEPNGTVVLERVALTNQTATPYVADGLTGLTPTNLLLDTSETTLYFTSAGQPYALTLDDGTYQTE